MAMYLELNSPRSKRSPSFRGRSQSPAATRNKGGMKDVMEGLPEPQPLSVAIEKYITWMSCQGIEIPPIEEMLPFSVMTADDDVDTPPLNPLETPVVPPPQPSPPPKSPIITTGEYKSILRSSAAKRPRQHTRRVTWRDHAQKNRTFLSACTSICNGRRGLVDIWDPRQAAFVPVPPSEQTSPPLRRVSTPMQRKFIFEEEPQQQQNDTVTSDTQGPVFELEDALPESPPRYSPVPSPVSSPVSSPLSSPLPQSLTVETNINEPRSDPILSFRERNMRQSSLESLEEQIDERYASPLHRDEEDQVLSRQGDETQSNSSSRASSSRSWREAARRMSPTFSRKASRSTANSPTNVSSPEQTSNKPSPASPLNRITSPRSPQASLESTPIIGRITSPHQMTPQSQQSIPAEAEAAVTNIEPEGEKPASPERRNQRLAGTIIAIPGFSRSSPRGMASPKWRNEEQGQRQEAEKVISTSLQNTPPSTHYQSGNGTATEGPPKSNNYAEIVWKSKLQASPQTPTMEKRRWFRRRKSTTPKSSAAAAAAAAAAPSPVGRLSQVPLSQEPMEIVESAPQQSFSTQELSQQPMEEVATQDKSEEEILAYPETVLTDMFPAVRYRSNSSDLSRENATVDRYKMDAGGS